MISHIASEVAGEGSLRETLYGHRAQGAAEPLSDSGGDSGARTRSLRLAKPALSQLSYIPEGVGGIRAKRSRPRTRSVVGLGGLEPPTSRLSGVRSNQLSYRPTSRRGGDRVRAGRTPAALSPRVL